MSDTYAAELTTEQKSLLLRGLRFVRSSISMDLREPSKATDAQRAAELREVDDLVGELNGHAKKIPAAV